MDKKSYDVSLGTLYDFNKQLMKNEKRMTKTEIAEKKLELENWFNWQIDGYAMLLCRERYDFTVFHLYESQNENPLAIATQELIDVLKNRGHILSIEKQQDNTWEIWIRINNENFAYYLFNCDDWVIEC